MGMQNVKAFCKDNSHKIFTVFAIIGSIAAVVETARATIKTCKDISDAEYDKWEEQGCPEDEAIDCSLTTTETIGLVWTNYIFSAVLLGGAVTCEILALRAGQKKIDGLTGSVVLLSQMVTAVKDSVRESLPPRDVQRIEERTVHKLVDNDKEDERILALIQKLQAQGPTSTIYRDAYSPSGVYYKGDMNQFLKAVHLYNVLLERYEVATLNDWYNCLSRVGIDVGQTDLGDYLEFRYHDDGPMELYCITEQVDPEMPDDKVVRQIGLRRRDSAMDDLAIPTTPRRS